MNNTLKLPVGIENFEDIRKLEFYYIDKTKLIEQLLQNWAKVNLFTRPRRFGKTLCVSSWGLSSWGLEFMGPGPNGRYYRCQVQINIILFVPGIFM